MKKSEFRNLVKEVVKETLHETLFESGIISSIISEVIKGTMPVLKESSFSSNLNLKQTNNNQQEQKEEKQKINTKLNETRKKLLESIGKDAYNGVNVFEGLKPISAQKEMSPSTSYDPLKDLDPSDKGVDITGIMQFSKHWDVLAKGKKGK